MGRVAAAGGGTGQPLVYWSGGYRALTPDQESNAQLSNAADGVAVALHLLGVTPADMVDAQEAIEPTLCAFAALRGSAADWDRLSELALRSAEFV